MARSYVTNISTSIKGGVKDETIGRYTLFIGPNTSGKSTRVNAIEAAGSGRVSDVAGRASLAKDADLMMLAPYGRDNVGARLTLSDGTTAEWTLSRGHRASRTGSVIAFPIRDAREAILGEPDKARKWILKNVGGVAWKEVLRLVPKALHSRLKEIAIPPADGEDATIALVNAIDAAKTRARDTKRDATSARAGEKPSQPPPTDKEIAAAEKVVASLALVEQGAAARARIAEIEATLAPGRERLAIMLEEERSFTALLVATPQPPPISDVMKSALLVAEALAGAKANSCAICGHEIPDPDTFKRRAETARKKLDDALRVGQERDRLGRGLAEVQSKIARGKHNIALLEGERSRLEKMLADVPIVADPAAARQRLSDLHALRAAWDLVSKGEDRALEIERDRVEWEQLAAALSTALGRLVDLARAAFEAKVQVYLPPTWTFGVDLLDGEREVLRIGLREAGGTLRCALSGAEWAAVTAALGLATAPKDGPIVIAPEERAFDPGTLAAVMEAFARIGDEAQVILTSPVGPSRIVAGWTLVKVEKGAAPSTVVEAREVVKKPKTGKKDPETGAGPGRPPKARTVVETFEVRDGKLVEVDGEENDGDEEALPVAEAIDLAAKRAERQPEPPAPQAPKGVEDLFS